MRELWDRHSVATARRRVEWFASRFGSTSGPASKRKGTKRRRDEENPRRVPVVVLIFASLVLRDLRAPRGFGSLVLVCAALHQPYRMMMKKFVSSFVVGCWRFGPDRVLTRGVDAKKRLHRYPPPHHHSLYRDCCCCCFEGSIRQLGTPLR